MAQRQRFSVKLNNSGKHGAGFCAYFIYPTSTSATLFAPDPGILTARSALA